jgi:Fe-S cluster assembly protein SufD
MTLETIRLAAQEVASSNRLNWLQPLRSAALSRIELDGLPTRALEEWRYTDIGPALAMQRETSLPCETPSSPALLSGGDSIIFATGESALAAGHAEIGEPGLRMRSFRDLASEERTSIAALMGTLSGLKCSSIADLNMALLDDGMLLEVAPEAELSRPVEIMIGNSTRQQSRIVVRLGAGATATIVAHHRHGGSQVTNTVFDIEAGPGSRLSLLRLQVESQTATHLSCLRLLLEADAEVSLQQLDLGGHLSRSELLAALQGTDSRLQSHSLLLADGDRHVDQYSRVAHIGERSTSRQVVRSIADGTGRAVFNGRIVVTKTASGTDATLTNQNMLLSGGAEIDTRPELEIDTDDVRCSHGATTGQLDVNSLFYLRSRGIGLEAARQMLIGAFARSIVEQTPALIPKSALEVLLARQRPEWSNWSSL